MIVLPEQVILGFHNAGETAHQDAAFSCKIAVNLIFKGGGEEVSRAYGNAQGKRSLFGLSGMVLKYGVTGVDAASCQKIRANGASCSFGGNHNHIYVVWWNHTGLIFVNNRKAM